MGCAVADIVYGFIITYVKDLWRKEYPNGDALPLLARVLLHLTITKYASVILAGIQKPYRKADILQSKSIVLLYHCTTIMEKKTIRIISTISEVMVYTLTLIGMVLLSHVINTTVVFCLYLTMLAASLGLRTTIIGYIRTYVMSHSYSALLYKQHLR